MQTQFSFRHNEFNIEVEWNNGNPSATIWSNDYKELLFTFDIDFEKVGAPNEHTEHEVYNYEGDGSDVTHCINHYDTGFTYCVEEVVEFIIENQPAWQKYQD